MILIACSECNSGLLVMGEPTEVDVLVGCRSGYWPDRYTCFRCSSPAHGVLSAEVSPEVYASLHITRVTAAEAYIALNGLGVPDERTCCEEVLLPLFEKVNVRVVGKPTGALRYVIDELVFPDGTRVCLAASPQGATVYRIVKPHSYVEKVGG